MGLIYYTRARWGSKVKTGVSVISPRGADKPLLIPTTYATVYSSSMKLKPQIPRSNSNFTFADKNTTVYIGINVNRVSGVDENREVTTYNYSYIISCLSQYRFMYFLKFFFV